MALNCPKCNYRNVEGDLNCGLCGELLAARKSAKPQELDAYLICFPYKPIRLVKGTTYTLGRDKENDFVLTGQVVSRRHAQVAWKGQGFAVTDLKSSNGTFVDGQRVEEQPLRGGENLRIGNYDLQFRLVPRGVGQPDFAGAEETSGKTLVLDFGAAGGGQRSAFAGNLRELGLSQILQILSLEGKTGRLKLDFAGTGGHLALLKGNVVHAALGDEEGLPAFQKMCRQAEGSFAFESDRQPEKQTLSGSTHALLLEAFRQQDEDRRDGPTAAVR